MADAICRFTGQRVGRAFTLPWRWGVRPSTCNIVTTFNVGDLPRIGALRITMRGRDVVNLSNCRLSGVQAVLSSQGGTGELALRVEDRRWQWQFGTIDGDYNVPGESGRLVREKTPQELAALLCAAMGETGVDVRALPNQTRPRVFWYAANPARELERLCLSLGCVPQLNPLTDRMEILQIGSGDGLPTGGAVVSNAPGILPAALPDQIRTVTGPTLFQSRLKLRVPVGLDTDMQLKPIDDLSYKPAAGWTGEHPKQFAGVTGTFTPPGATEPVPLATLALASVYKLYRCNGQYRDGSYTPLALKGGAYEPTELDDLLPLLPHRLDKDPVTLERLPPIVRGEFVEPRGKIVTTDPDEQYRGDFSVRGDIGVVEFPDPMVRVVASGSQYLFADARLSIELAYNVRHNGVPVRYERFRDLPRQQRSQTGPYVEHHDEIAVEVIERRTQTTSTESAVQQQCDYYLDALAARFRESTGRTTVYPGLQSIATTGKIRSVVWSSSVDGAPTTMAAEDSEPNLALAPWEDLPEQRAKRAAEYAAADRARKQLLARRGWNQGALR